MTTDSTMQDDDVGSLIRVHRSYGPYGQFVATFKDVFDDYRANSNVQLTLRAQCGSDSVGLSSGFYGHNLGVEPRGRNPIGLDDLKVVTKLMSKVERNMKKLDDKHGVATTMTDWTIRLIQAIGIVKVRVAFRVLDNEGYTPMNWPVRHLKTKADLANLGSELALLESQILRETNPVERAA